MRDPRTYEGFSYEDKRYRTISAAALRTKVRNAIRKGKGVVGREGRLARAVINYAGRCDLPVLRLYRAADGVCVPSKGFLGCRGLPKGVDGYLVQELLRCRKCEACRVSRAWEWANRARDEFDQAACTWLGTVTLSPESHALIDARVAKTARRKGIDLREVDASQLFALRAREAGAELSLYFKRLRKHGRKVRYLLVAEVHTGERRPGTPGYDASRTVEGRPHFHLLVHEECPGDFIKPDETYVVKTGPHAGELRADDKSLVKKEWELGFTQYKLCSDRDEALYLCSYLKPDSAWRIRASQHYGKTAETYLGGTREAGGERSSPATKSVVDKVEAGFDERSEDVPATEEGERKAVSHKGLAATGKATGSEATLKWLFLQPG